MDKRSFDFKGIQPAFEELAIITSNKLEREFPKRFGQYDSAQIVYMLRFRLALNTYEAILFLCADLPKDPHRPDAFALAVPPMVRTLFEELITIIFLLHDTEKYVPYLYQTEYNEKKRELEFAKKYHSGKPLWDNYIKRLTDTLKKMEVSYGKSDAEFKKIGKYPSTGNMISMGDFNRHTRGR